MERLNEYGGHRDRHENHEHHDHSIKIDVTWAEIDGEAHTQDEACVLSCSFRLPDDTGMTPLRLAHAMRRISQAIDASGGLTGHVKAIVKEGGGIRISVTDSSREPVLADGRADMPCAGADVDLAVIGLLITREQLQSIVASELAKL